MMKGVGAVSYDGPNREKREFEKGNWAEIHLDSRPNYQDRPNGAGKTTRALAGFRRIGPVQGRPNSDFLKVGWGIQRGPTLPTFLPQMERGFVVWRCRGSKEPGKEGSGSQG